MSGQSVIFHPDPEVDGGLIIETVQDCTAIAERAKAMHNEGMGVGKNMRLAMTLPNIMIDKYCNDQGVSFHEFMSNEAHIKRVLQDPALADFRVWNGAV